MREALAVIAGALLAVSCGTGSGNESSTRSTPRQTRTETTTTTRVDAREVVCRRVSALYARAIENPTAEITIDEMITIFAEIPDEDTELRDEFFKIGGKFSLTGAESFLVWCRAHGYGFQVAPPASPEGATAANEKARLARSLHRFVPGCGRGRVHRSRDRWIEGRGGGGRLGRGGCSGAGR